MSAQVQIEPQQRPHWAGLDTVRIQNINVTIAAPSASDASTRVLQTLSRVEGVVRVEPRAPAVTPGVPDEMEAFANRLWEVM